MSDSAPRRGSRGTLLALAQGAVVGAVVALAIVLAVTFLNRPPEFPSSVVALPSPATPPVATPFVRGDLPIVLGPEGIGVATFGEAEDPVVDTLTAALGLPNEDITFACTDPATDVRVVRWADLSTFFIGATFEGFLDGLYYPNDGVRMDLATADGIGLEATRAELSAAYGDRVRFTAAPPGIGDDVEAFLIDDGTLMGLVEGAGDTGIVITIRAGLFCFPNS